MTTEPDYDPIEMDGVTKVYGSTVALDGVDLRIESGDFHCLVGPNGSGKTTLFRLILGHTKPTSGRVRVPHVVLGCGFQQPSVYSDLTVNENLSVFGALSSARDEEWVDSLLEALRLHRVEDRVASELSDGYAKKLDIALALMEKPDYLLLDEPLADLDDVSKLHLVDLLADYASEGTVLVSTHNVSNFEEHLDRLTVLHDADVVYDGRREQVERDASGYESVQEMYVEMVYEIERAGD